MLYAQLKHLNECSRSPHATGSSLQPHQEMLPQTQLHSIHLCLNPNPLRFNPTVLEGSHPPPHSITGSSASPPLWPNPNAKSPHNAFSLSFLTPSFCPLPFLPHWVGSSPPHNEAMQSMGTEGAPSSHCSTQSSQAPTPLKRLLIDENCHPHTK